MTTKAKSHLARKQVPLLSFFTGAGFLDLGFHREGFTSLWHNEFNASFAAAFEYAMEAVGVKGAAANVQAVESIVTVSAKQALRTAFGNGERPQVFGVIGGPPCPDFSVGGKNRGHLGEHGILTSVYAERVLELAPTFFLLENVPGLLRTAKHREFFGRVRGDLDKHYLTSTRILNALELGIPQDRERVFLLGFRKSWLRSMSFKPDAKALQQDTWFPWPADSRYAGAKRRFDWPGVDPFGGQPEKPKGVPIVLTLNSVLPTESQLAALANGRECFHPWSDKFSEIREGDTSRKSFKRLHRWRYSPTAAYGNNEVHLHPFQPRRLTVREALRIQSVPDEYALPTDLSLSFKFKMIGNGVPVALASKVACAIRVFIESVER